jgi:hypothetical protein
VESAQAHEMKDYSSPTASEECGRAWVARRKAGSMAKKNIPQSEWVWYGDPGHFICGRWCRFHLTTKVGAYLVSTVGAYVHPQRSMGSEQVEAEWLKKNWPGEDIGLDRKYETMVFHAGPECKLKDCNCGIPMISGEELDMLGYNTAGEAAKGHLALCKKWSKK